MTIARTRSSRFFLVVLHLVCPVLTTISITGEIKNPSSSIKQQQEEDANNNNNNISNNNNNNNNNNKLPVIEPYWLQDANDSKCFGPMGLFSECGDSNLWRVIPKSKRHARRRQWIRWATEDVDYENQQEALIQGYYALQVYADQDHQLIIGGNNKLLSEEEKIETISSKEQQQSTNKDGNNKNEDFTDMDCLTRRRKDNKLVIVSCSQDRAWYWKVNEYGTLHFDKPTRVGFGSTRSSSSSRRAAATGTKNRSGLFNKQRLNLDSCVWRNSDDASSEAFLSSCDGNQPANTNHNSNQNSTSSSSSSSSSSLLLDHNDGDDNKKKSVNNRVVQIQFVRHNYQQQERGEEDMHQYPPSSRPRPPSSTIKKSSDNNSIKKPPQQQQQQQQITKNINLPPSRVDIAHSHASVLTDRTPELRLLPFHVTSILPHRRLSETAQTDGTAISKQSIPRFFGNTNPILIATGHHTKLTTTKTKKSLKGEEKKKRSSLLTQPPKVLHTNDSPSSSPSLSEKPIIRKIQMNPYVATSNEERWTDPQNGLIYHTDLCQYLGHERKDAGRHTLTGVGQYTKTMLKIKVYGVGYYASKRDILADPSFEPYASLSSEGLRERPEFFDILRSMKGFTTNNGPAGSFDRTIFLKINMQLSTETMRSSLDADWKMLTQEAKDLLIGSSMRPRPADPIFLGIAMSPDNPNRCTCAQVAPAEYNADPSCCARGTELVFTWRKNGDLEVRLNGVFMDTFQRPDIAEGIFYEYLRLDNPMSYDFLDRVVDGFPMLLAPLSQVKGYATPYSSHQTNTATHAAPTGKPVFRLIGGVGGAISSQAATLADFVQSGAHDIAGGAMDKARSVGSTARKMGEEVERRTDLIGKHVSTFTNQALSSFYPSDQKSVSIPVPFPGWITDSELEEISANLFEQSSVTTPERETTYTRIISRIIGLEEGSMSASNVTQKLIFGMVHLYLLLLLIASFPAKWSTRTKSVVTRKTTGSSYMVAVPADSENSDSDESGASSVEILDDTRSMMAEKEIQLKKSLSYVL